MQSNGGYVPSSRADAQAHRLLLSGPTAAVTGTVALGARYGIGGLISLDMGGTSLDVCLVRDGVVPVTRMQSVDDHPVLCSAVEIVTAGAAGGSIAYTDQTGRLHVGPESSGARPGPAAYGLGGQRATVTDAHVATGILPADLDLAGGLKLDAAAARAAVRRLADALALAEDETALGIVAITCAHVTATIGAYRSSAASTPAITRLSRSGARARCTPGLYCASSSSAAPSSPPIPGSSPRPGWSPRTCGSTSRAPSCAGTSPRQCVSSAAGSTPPPAAAGQLRTDGVRRVPDPGHGEPRLPLPRPGLRPPRDVPRITRRARRLPPAVPGPPPAHLRLRRPCRAGGDRHGPAVGIRRLRPPRAGPAAAGSRTPVRAALLGKAPARLPGGPGARICRSTSAIGCARATACWARRSSTRWTPPRWCWTARRPTSTSLAACGSEERTGDRRRGCAQVRARPGGSIRSPSNCCTRPWTPRHARWGRCSSTPATARSSARWTTSAARSSVPTATSWRRPTSYRRSSGAMSLVVKSIIEPVGCRVPSR